MTSPLSPDDRDAARAMLAAATELGLSFKLQAPAWGEAVPSWRVDELLEPLPRAGVALESLLEELGSRILPYSVNPASRGYMGLPYAGNALPALVGGVLDLFLQQNLMHVDWSPIATTVEIVVLQWLRELVGYRPISPPIVAAGAGGIITAGGTASNTVAMLLAREHRAPGALDQGVTDPSKLLVLVPRGLTHYSVGSALRWIGCGGGTIEVKTDDFRFDLASLEKEIRARRGQVMAVVALAGDGKTMTVERLRRVAELVKSIDDRIWLHADACHGFVLSFSQALRPALDGLELFDSVAVDPHKVLGVPFPLGALLVRDPASLLLLLPERERERRRAEQSFGLFTPFFGSKPWWSLKLWLLIKALGAEAIGRAVEARVHRAQVLATVLRSTPELLVVASGPTSPAVLFFYRGHGALPSLSVLNRTSRRIAQELRRQGAFHLHVSSLVDPGVIQAGATLHPLRYMSGNDLLEVEDLHALVQRVRELGARLLGESAELRVSVDGLDPDVAMD